MTAQPDPLALAGEQAERWRKRLIGFLDAPGAQSFVMVKRGDMTETRTYTVDAFEVIDAALRTDQDARPAAEGVRAEGFAAGIEAAAAYHDAQAANAKVRYEELDRYSDCSDERLGWRSWKDANDRHRYYAATFRALAQTDAVAAAMAERESDGEPYWVDRFGDNVAPERGR